jgi:hypothetical protein
MLLLRIDLSGRDGYRPQTLWDSLKRVVNAITFVVDQKHAAELPVTTVKFRGNPARILITPLSRPLFNLAVSPPPAGRELLCSGWQVCC